MAVNAIDTICPHCGYIQVYFNPSKFPICECCGYEDPVIIDNNDLLQLEKELKAKDPDASAYEALREKYVYSSEHFSKKLTMICSSMLRSENKKSKKNTTVFVILPNAPPAAAPTCAKCPWVQRLCLWACSVSLARK